MQELCAVSSYLMTTFKVLVAIGQSEFVFGLFNFSSVLGTKVIRTCVCALPYLIAVKRDRTFLK